MHPTPTTWGVVLCAVMFALPVGAEEPSPEALEAPGTGVEAAPAEPPRTGWHVLGLPLVSFNSDEGFGYGARLMLVDSGDGSQRPYRYSVVAQFFQSTRGIAQHRLMLDAPSFLSSSWRLGVSLSMLNDRFSPYFGLGGGAAYVPAFEACEDRKALESDPNVCPGNPDFRGLRYYNFEQRTLPSVVLNARRPLSGPWQVALGYRFRLTTVRTRYGAEDLGQARDSRVVEDARAGLLSGLDGVEDGEAVSRTAEVTASLLLDTRDNEPAPVRGMFHELALRGASTVTGSGSNYWGATANLRFYHPLVSDRLVAALRLFVDVMGGDVPFYHLSSFGGVEWLDGWGGIGGVYTARGILKNRLQGQAKALANGELRWNFLSVSPWQQRLDFTLIAFFDAGQAWTDLRFADGGLPRYGGGGGLRIAWQNDFILRVDYGISPRDGTTGFYLDFGHMF
ncbi:outer membrane protein assembly factor [Archangium lipolyticum]|uniref:outer membrane protein assembly factor n=1 Tax=Archangium lipolyticum TaxID=2970465 RepID=UPI00214A0AA9|nr:outer membrane protein assembly factor [Archangium lipolyticum]